MILNVKVKNRIATYIQSEEKPVCGNSGDEVKFAFDEEWAEHEAKTARFKWNGKHHDVEFTGDTCEVPIISNASSITVGVFVGEDAEGEDEISTTDATIPYKLSTRCGRSVASANTGANYTNEARGYAAEAAASAEDAKGYMEATEGMSAEVQAKAQAEIAFYDAYYASIRLGRDYGVSDPEFYYAIQFPTVQQILATKENGVGMQYGSDYLVLPPCKNRDWDFWDGIFADCDTMVWFIVPYGVTCIPTNAFSNCACLKEITLPSSITSIDAGAFYATAIESIDIPDSVTYLDTAFNDCYSLKAVNFGKNSKLEYIQPWMFSAISTKFQYFKVPKSVKSIGSMAFSNGTHTFTLDLTEYGQNTSFPTAGGTIFYHGDNMTDKNDAHIKVPKGRKAELAAMTNWSEYADIIEEVEA